MSEIEALTLRKAADLLEVRVPHVLITLATITGSAPQDASAKLLVSAAGRVCGTVGGGKLEAAAIRRAVEFLKTEKDQTHLETWDLKRDVGMTCGGRVTLLFEARAAKPWTVAIFGAGHVAQALVRVLLPMPLLVEVRDPREEWIAELPHAANVKGTVCREMASAVKDLPSGTFVVCLTQGHQTDLPVLIAALRRGFPFIGAIGSKTKATTLRRELKEAGIPAANVARLHCPLGLDLGSNHPQEIAISISAQLLLERDRLHEA